MAIVNEKGEKKTYDLYRDSYIRYLGYSNEVGEAFRHLWPRGVVHFSYGLAVAYVLADCFDKTKKEQQKPGTTNKDLAIKSGDVFTWQMLASVIIPGFTINRIVKGTGALVRHFNRNCKMRNVKYIPTMVGLASIPIIIHPIDRLVDTFMDKTYRRFFKTDAVAETPKIEAAKPKKK